MGRVFSLDEIRRGMVPKIGSFDKSVQEIRARLASTEGVLGAVICGSALSGTITVRSDIDCVVVYERERRNPALEALRSLHGFAASLHVPTEFIPIDSVVAAQGLHSIGRSFATHLERAANRGGVIKYDPLAFIRFPDRDSRRELVLDVMSYLTHKIRRFEKGLVELPVMNPANTELYRFLQKVLESPIHIARKVMCLSATEYCDDSREEVKKRYPRMVRMGLAEPFQILVQEDEDYSWALDEQIRNPEDREGRYDAVLERVKRRAFWALEFARRNAIFVSNVHSV